MTWDPYAALGVARAASQDDIRSAYRKLVKELHPDVRPGDAKAEERFKRVSIAFALLSDTEKRAKFDRGEIDADGNERGPFASSGTYGGGFGGARNQRAGRATAESPFDLDDIFADILGGRTGTGRRAGAGAGPNASARGGTGSNGAGAQSRPRDVRFTLDVDFVDSITGAKRTVDLNGKRVEVSIPAGVESGQTLRLRGQGEPAFRGGPSGDALIEMTVRSHAHFRRDGDMVLLDLPISLAEAVEGGQVTAPTPFGPVQLKIPPASNTGATLRLKGKGVGGRGDMLVTLRLVLADPSDPELTAFVRNAKSARKAPPRP